MIILTVLFHLAALNAAESNQSMESELPVIDLHPLLLDQEITPFISYQVNNLDEKNIDWTLFKKLENNELKINYTDKNIWILFRIRNDLKQPIERTLKIDSNLTGNLELFQKSENGQLRTLGITGSAIPFYQRILPLMHPGFKIVLNAGVNEFLLKRSSHHRLDAKFYLGSYESFIRTESAEQSLYFLYIGGILILNLYNIIIYFFFRDRSYIYYSIFSISFLALVLNTKGFLDEVFYFEQFTLSNYLLVFSAFTNFAAHLFAIKFLELRKTTPKMVFGNYVIMICSVFLMLWPFLDFLQPHYYIAGYIVDFLIVISMIFLISEGVYLFRKKEPTALYFLVSWMFLFSAALVWFGMYAGVFAKSVFVDNILLAGGVLEMLTLSLGLVQKIRHLDFLKKEAEEKALQGETYHRLLRVLVHDVANGLTLLQGLVTIFSKVNTSPEVVRFTDKMKLGLNNISQNLSQARSEEVLRSYQKNIQLEPVNLFKIVRDAMLLLDQEFETKKIGQIIQINKDHEVYAEKTSLLNQVLMNCFTNAIKFSRPGSSVQISSEKKGTDVYLYIHDHGIGMSKEEIQKIFFSDELYSKSGTGGERGSGIGTSLIKEYIKLYKGQIEVSSIAESADALNSGTKITLIFKSAKNDE